MGIFLVGGGFPW